MATNSMREKTRSQIVGSVQVEYFWATKLKLPLINSPEKVEAITEGIIDAANTCGRLINCEVGDCWANAVVELDPDVAPTKFIWHARRKTVANYKEVATEEDSEHMRSFWSMSALMVSQAKPITQEEKDRYLMALRTKPWHDGIG